MSSGMISSRQKILTRVREALAVPTDPHVRHSELAVVSDSESSAYRDWLPAVPSDYEGRQALFREWSVKLKTEFICVADVASARSELMRLGSEEKWNRVGYHSAGCVGELAKSMGHDLVCTDTAYDVADLESCEVGITGCDVLIAQTGSVLVTNASAGGRALSVLPPHHVVIATKDQLIADLLEGFAILHQKYSHDWPSFISLITGPSRTGDIERILVLGAHGPRRLTVILIGDDSHR